MFKKIIRKLINWAQSNDLELDSMPYPIKSRVGTTSNRDIIESNHGSNFTIFKAVSGKVVRVQRYDERTDKSHSTLYIINDGDDIGQELSMILSMESLTH